MLIIEYDPKFLDIIKKIKNGPDCERVKKLIKKIIENPTIGKPMRYTRKGTRELYIGSYRLSYAHEYNKIVFLSIYHKDEQ